MFAPRYFANRYFAPRYWPVAGAEIVAANLLPLARLAPKYPASSLTAGGLAEISPAAGGLARNAPNLTP